MRSMTSNASSPSIVRSTRPRSQALRYELRRSATESETRGSRAMSCAFGLPGWVKKTTRPSWRSSTAAGSAARRRDGASRGARRAGRRTARRGWGPGRDSFEVLSLERCDLVAKRLRHGDGLALVEGDADECRLRARHQRVVVRAVSGVVVGDARRADALDAAEDLEQVVEARRRDVLDGHRAHREVDLAEVHAAEVPVELGPREIEVRHVAAVVDDPLGIGVREADANERGVAKRRLALSHVPELDHRAILARLRTVPGTVATVPSVRQL